jgi:hypothetical protein
MDGLTVLHRGKLGQVLVEDERDDGAVIVLICRPWDDGPPTGIPLPSGKPSSQTPPEPDELEDKYSGAYPMLRAFASTARVPAAKVLTIDTSGLPKGPLAFKLETFLERLELIGDEFDHVTLDVDTAQEWGLGG